MLDDKIKLIADSIGPEKFKFNEPVAPFTALGVGGPAKLFFIAFTQQEIIKIVEMARSLKVPLIVFGTGSKHMISDKGFDGIVVKNRTKNMSVVGVKGKVSKEGIGVSEAMVEVDSGVSLNALVEFLIQQNLDSSGLENLPGSIGGNLFLNRSLQDKVQKIKILNEDSDEEEINSDQLNLRKQIILSAVFKFKAI